MFDTRNHHRLALIDVDPAPVGIAISPDARRVYVASTAGDRIDVIDMRTRRRLGGFRTGREPDGMAWTWEILVRPDLGVR